MRGRAVLENKDLALVPGLFGRIRILGSDATGRAGARRRRSAPTRTGASSMSSRQDGRSTLQPVRVGSRVDGYRVIREGLKGDEKIVINGLMRVRPGHQGRHPR